ncbi:energy transducer TonB [Fulvivirga maritima]|uniref:energy transducer TonB n=1 Tax=Fulvivirga maritima TaxID=2904247 RepID=UPI001F40978C|nr:energy transducer TonB [Fulvivirga maritima]UII27372.1 energy transducer TonB [Fulvivirga maritima]
MEDIQNINLAFPCDQNRGTLSKKDQQLHCAKCQHQVHDFTEKNAKELNNEVINATRPVCGIFKAHQLSKSFLKYASLSLLATATACSQDLLPEPAPVQEIIIEEGNEEFLGIIIEASPMPEAGFEQFYKSLSEAIKLPKNLTDHPAKVYVGFMVNTNGDMTNIEVLKGGSEELNKIIIDAIKGLNYHFKPAEQKGIKVESRMVVPITLKNE